MIRLRLDTRAVEALLTVLMLNLGLVYITPGETFALPQYHGLYHVIEDWIVGLILILSGGFRWTAVLFTNGPGNKLYYVRIFTAFISLINWTLIAVATWTAMGVLAAIFAVASSCIIFELFAIIRTYYDMRRGTVLVVVEKDVV